MSLARGTQIRPVNFEIPMLQLPFEQIYGQMQEYQRSKDTFDVLKDTLPQYLQQDSEYANAYQQMSQGLSQTVTNAFAEGKTSEAMRALREAQTQLKNEWQPGGLAYALQDRHTSFTAAQKAIEDHTKDFVDPSYRQFYQHQLGEMANQNMSYDPATKRWSRISTPQMQGEVKLGEETDAFLSGWKSDKGYSITKSPDGFWYYKETNERVDPNELRQALQGFYNQPHIQYALGVQGWAGANQLPPEQREVALQQVRQQARQEAEGRLNQQRARLDQMEQTFNTGDRTRIRQLQEMLNQAGYQLNPDGIAGDATKRALQDYLQDTRSELDDLAGQVETAAENVTLESYYSRQFQQSLTEAYVPKHSFTHEDVDMIANTPLLAMMRIRAQQAAVKALTMEVNRPAPTLLSEVKAEPLQLQLPVQEYNTARQSYQEASTAISRGIDPTLRSAITPQNFVNPTQISDPHADMNNVLEASRRAVQGGQFSTERYVQEIRRLNPSYTSRQIQQQAQMLADPTNRATLQEAFDALTPMRAAVEATGDVVRSLRESVINSGEVDWTAVGAMAGLQRTENLNGVVRRLDPSEETVQSALQRNDPNVVQALDRWVAQNISKSPALQQSLTAGNMFVNEDLEPFREQIETAVRTNIGSLINFNNLTEQQRAQLGLDKNGEVTLDKDGKPLNNVRDVQFGMRDINGRMEPVIWVRTDKSPAPISLNYQNLQRPWVRELLRSAAGTTLNPNNPGEIMDEPAFNTFAAALFDADNANPGTTFSANLITNRVQNGSYGQVGATTINTQGGTAEVTTFVLPGSQGGANYLISTTNPEIAEQLRNRGNRATLSPLDMENLRMEGSSTVVPVGTSYETNKQAVHASKAALYSDEVMNDLLTNPYKYQSSSNNRTSEALQIGTSIILGDTDF